MSGGNAEDLKSSDFQRGFIVSWGSMKHCNQNIDILEIWYLKDIKEFYKRRFVIGRCAVCKKKISVLVEKRCSDEKIFKNVLTGLLAEKTAIREKKRINYTLSDLKNNNKSDGWIYGVNKEIRNKKGEVKQIRQYASNFSNNKTLVKKIYS